MIKIIQMNSSIKASTICFITTKNVKKLGDILHADIKIALEVLIKPHRHKEA